MAAAVPDSSRLAGLALEVHQQQKTLAPKYVETVKGSTASLPIATIRTLSAGMNASLLELLRLDGRDLEAQLQ